MKKDYKAIYFDNYNSEEILSKEEFESLLKDRFSDEELKAMTDEEKTEHYYEEYNLMEQDEFDMTYDSLMSYFGNNTVLAKGSCGRWNGTSSGIVIINYGSLSDYSSIESFLHSFLGDCDYYRIGITNDNKIFIKASHHDGTNYVEFKIVTGKGEDLYEGHYHSNRLPDYDDRMLLNKLWSSKVYSSKLDKDFNLFDF